MTSDAIQGTLTVTHASFSGVLGSSATNWPLLVLARFRFAMVLSIKKPGFRGPG